MASQRITLVANKKTNAIKVSKREIAQLLENKKEEKAKIRVEALIQEDLTIEAYEIIELLCDVLVQRLRLIEADKVCPLDMKETICTLIWCANRTEIPELGVVQQQLTLKYGKEFAKDALDNKDNCVNARLVHKLSIKPPNARLVLLYLEEIAKAFKVDWECTDPALLDPPGEWSDAPMHAPTGYSVPVSAGAGFGHLHTAGGGPGISGPPAGGAGLPMTMPYTGGAPAAYGGGAGGLPTHSGPPAGAYDPYAVPPVPGMMHPGTGVPGMARGPAPGPAIAPGPVIAPINPPSPGMIAPPSKGDDDLFDLPAAPTNTTKSPGFPGPSGPSTSTGGAAADAGVPDYDELAARFANLKK